ncbi:DNA polymerase domain-containing protein [Euzebya tangerina]|uniref:DNA polymerase domain-containing protein n=1 Tax=Euzebya tangerina TaxID=591198 RepID=UPI000E32295E|nr:DNA primase small subunit domain-containing protein [Euzebya tangerina]
MSDSAGDPIVLDLAGRAVRITSPDKVFFPKREETKLDLVRYYEAVEEPLMATLGRRPLLLERFPDGARGKSFFQKRVPKGVPEWLQTTMVQTVNGTPSNALVGVDLAHIAWAVNMGCLGFHVWPLRVGDDGEVVVFDSATRSRIEQPDIDVEQWGGRQRRAVADELRLDLDPAKGVGFGELQRAALLLKDLLDELGIACFPKTSGKRGIHVYVRLEPRWDSYEVRAGAVALARELERRHPEQLTWSWWKEERGERVFVDYNQNAPHKTVFGAWGARPKVGAQVSAPFRWEELGDIVPDDLTISTVPPKVAAEGDPWAAMYDDPQSLEPLLALHDRDMAAGLMDAPWPPVYPKMPGEPPRVAPSRAKKE